MHAQPVEGCNIIARSLGILNRKLIFRLYILPSDNIIPKH